MIMVIVLSLNENSDIDVYSDRNLSDFRNAGGDDLLCQALSISIILVTV